MTLRVKLELLAALAALIGLVIGFRVYISEHDARIKAEAVQAAQQQIQQQVQQQLNVLTKQMADRDAAYRQELSVVQSKFQAAATPQQVAQLLTSVMGLKQPVTIQIPSPTLQEPHPTAQALVPEVDFSQVKDYASQCEECKLDRDKLTKDAVDLHTTVAAKDATIKSVTEERDTWIQTAKGGTKLQRIKKAADWILYGAAGAAVLLCGSGHCK